MSFLSGVTKVFGIITALCFIIAFILMLFGNSVCVGFYIAFVIFFVITYLLYKKNKKVCCVKVD